MKEALSNLPETLDETYERMLTEIEKGSPKDAMVLLRWLAYARSPPSLGELAEARVIDLVGDGSVDADDRGDLEDSLDILSGLVTLEGDGDDQDETRGLELEDSIFKGRDKDTTHAVRQVERDTRIRLAHFSVKEYLESKRILQSNAKDFHLETAKGQEFLAQSCLVYLIHYSSSIAKSSTMDDLVAFPLLLYAARSWFYHSSFQQSAEVGREVCLLSSETIKLDWLLVHRPDTTWTDLFKIPRTIGSSVYYASLVGLEKVVSMLIERGADVNAQGGYYSNPLQAASFEGHEKVVAMLLQRGADVNAQGGLYSNALQAASWAGHEKVVEILLQRGADVNAQGGNYSNALQAASFEGHEKVVEILLQRGADVNVQGGNYSNALQAASFEGHEKVVEMLIERGADVNAQGGEYGNALQAASYRGHEKVVEVLIERGADVNAQGGWFGNALQAASLQGHENVMQMLIAEGAR